MLKPGTKIKVVEDLLSPPEDAMYGDCIGLTGTVGEDKVEVSDEPPLYQVHLDESHTYYGENVPFLYFYAEEVEVVG